MKTWECPECDNVNPIDKAVCICGEKRPENRMPDNGYVNAHGQCSCPGCPMPGTMSLSFGKNAKWYCRWHYKHKDDYAHCARITADLNENRPNISGCKPDGTFVNCPPITEQLMGGK